MSQSVDIPVTVQDGEIDESLPVQRSVALIGPNDASRRVVAAALAGSGGANVREFLSYPARFPDVALILEERYDLLIMDVDSDESYALVLIEKLAAGGANVMAYSRRNQQDLILRCMQAGARDFLPLPGDDGRDSAEPDAALPEPLPAAPPVVEIEEIHVAPPAPELAHAPESAAPEPAAPEPVIAAPEVQRTFRPAIEVSIFQHVGVEPPPQKGRPKRLLIVAAATALLTASLAFAFFPQLQPARDGLLLRIGLRPAASDPASPSPAAPVLAQPAGKDSSATPAANPAAPASDAGTQRPSPRSEVILPVANSAPAMDDQISAPSRIPGNLKRPAPKDEPAAGFASTRLDSGSGAPGAAFAAHHNVQAAASAISAGVAAGMLIHRTEPVYPPIARAAHSSGTVVLAAVVTRAGTLQGVRVISGPSMLRQAALDAVKTWRYRPYLLNNQPVDVETTISIVFRLDR
jgi:periplasmic protein TonB